MACCLRTILTYHHTGSCSIQLRQLHRNTQKSNYHKMFKYYMFKISDTSPRGQWVKGKYIAGLLPMGSSQWAGFVGSVKWEIHSGHTLWLPRVLLNSLRPRQNGHHFTDNIFKWIFLNENVWIPIKISLKFVPQGPINNIPALVQIMAWRRPGDKPLSEPMVVILPTNICVTRPQWINSLHAVQSRSIT